MKALPASLQVAFSSFLLLKCCLWVSRLDIGRLSLGLWELEYLL
jgi:hypothetical protein